MTTEIRHMPAATDTGTSYRTGGWEAYAACSTAGLDEKEARRRIDLFAVRSKEQFRRYQNVPSKHPDIKEALSFCARCPVIEQCRNRQETTTDFPMVGVWGGRFIGFAEGDIALAKARRAAGMNTKPGHRHTMRSWD